jgi:4'-phosphopantetheinyl transferase
MNLALALPPDCTPLPAQDGCALWRVDLDGGSEADPRLLSAAEQARARRFAFARDRRRYVKSRVALRLLLAHRLDANPAELQLLEGPQGKPFVPDAPHCRFNVSHSHGMGLIGISTGADAVVDVGVDVEMRHWASDFESIAGTILTPLELRQLRAMEAGRRCEALLYAWTRKEACVKAIGTGLYIPPASFATGFSGDCQIHIADQGTTHVLRLQTIEAGNDVVASLAHMT